MADNFTSDFTKNIEMTDDSLRLNCSYDIIGRNILAAGKKIRIYFIDGLCKDDMAEKITSFLMKLTPDKLAGINDARTFADTFIPYAETDIISGRDQFIGRVLSGSIGIIIEGFPEAFAADARTYPMRSVNEPENDRVLRGAHDGFIESVLFNTALIRRRIRDVNLTMQAHSIGNRSQTDVVVCYMNNRVNPKMLNKLNEKLNSIDIDALTMGQESLLECLVPKQRLNPFPKVRYTERPDAAAASILEGSILILTDNSPAAMIIPSGIFDFLQDTNDFYMSPVVGSYMRIMRMFIFALTLLMIPIWYLLIRNPGYIPEWLSFIKIEEPNSVPVVAQLLIVEVVIDTMKLASINTPSALTNSFGVIGALVLGEFAVSAGWFVAEIVLYMAFVAMSNFAQPSFELGYAFKMLRVMFIVLIWLFNFYGFIAGIAIIIAMLASVKTVTGQCYLYPLIPFNGKALLSLLLRLPINNNNC